MTSTRFLAKKGLRRLSAALTITLMLTSCGDVQDAVSGGSKDPAPAPAPIGTAADSPLTMYVTATERKGDRVVLDMTVLNGGERPMTLTGDDRPMVLTTNTGATLRSTERPITVPAFNSDRMSVEFAGAVDEAGSAQLNVEARISALNQPSLRIDAIPLPESGRRTFQRDVVPLTAALDDKVAYHVNGSSLLLRAISVGPDGVEVSYLFVNGLNADNQISTEYDPVTLTDNLGRELIATPPANGAEAKVPAKGRASGVFRFPGALSPGATSVTIQINDSGSSTLDTSTSPKITIADIPVPTENR